MDLPLELYRPVWDSFTGPQPGLFTNENKKAFASYFHKQLKTEY